MTPVRGPVWQPHRTTPTRCRAFPGRSLRTMSTVLVLAHQGGWDEILLVAAPLAMFVLLVLLARKRARELADDPALDKPTSDD